MDDDRIRAMWNRKLDTARADLDKAVTDVQRAIDSVTSSPTSPSYWATLAARVAEGATAAANLTAREDATAFMDTGGQQ